MADSILPPPGTAPHGDGPPALRRRQVWLVYALSGLFFAGFALVFMRNYQSSLWFTCFAQAAGRMQAGETIHRIERDAYAYPPAMAFCAVPLAQLPPQVSHFVWYLVNVVATCVTFSLAWRMAGGPPVGRLSRRWWAILALGIVLGGRYVVAPLENRQFDMVIAALLMVGCHRLWRARDVSAGAWLGAAAAMKLTPLLFVPYLMWRMQWRAVVLLLAVAAGLNLLPDLLLPQTSGASYTREYVTTFLSGLSNSAPGQWHSDIHLNQSLAGFYNRVFALALPSANDADTGDAGGSPGRLLLLRALVYGTGLALMAVTFWRVGRPGRRTEPTIDARPVELDRLRTPAECAALFCLMLLLSPMSSKSHYVILLLPCFMVARWAVERVERRGWVIAAALIITGPLTAKGLIGKTLGDWTLVLGLPTIFVLVALAAMWLAMGATGTASVTTAGPARSGAWRRAA